ncbi:MAG: GNAT family N-acetyltransferase [Planctomycetota bacterium]|jgi:GNAT superfamily N-acetyltransferase
MTDVVYQLARLQLPQDREILRAFHNAYDREYHFGRNQNEQDKFLDYLQAHQNTYHCLVLFAGEVPVGYMRGYDRLSTSSCDIVFMLDVVYVLPDHRGKGIGKAMISPLIEYAKKIESPRTCTNS